MCLTVAMNTIQLTALLEYLDISHACIVLLYITSKSIILDECMALWGKLQ